MQKPNNKIFMQKGFTLVELLVCLFLSVLIIALLCQTILANNRLYKGDIVRTNLNQELRSAMVIFSSSVKEAGENLAGSFPAVELTKNEETGFSDLIIRRNVLDEVLKLCEPISSGDSVSNLKFALAGTTSGCIYSDNTHNFNAWKTYRVKNSGAVYPFIYDLEENSGEFFPYVNEEDTGAEYSLLTGGTTFSNNYTVGAASIYMLEEWRFSFEDGFLVLTQNGLVDEKQKIIGNVKTFIVQIEKSDGDIVDTFLPENNDMWSEISSINITLGNEVDFMKDKVEKTLSASFYPRNILSH